MNDSYPLNSERSLFNPFMFWGYDTEDINEKVPNYQTDENYRIKFIKFCIERYEDDREYFKNDSDKIKRIESEILDLKNALIQQPI